VLALRRRVVKPAINPAASYEVLNVDAVRLRIRLGPQSDNREYTTTSSTKEQKMEDIINWLTTNSAAVLTVLTAIVTIASVVANFTNTDSDNKVVALLSKVVNWLAANWVKKA
jgi:hypothetical protein